MWTPPSDAVQQDRRDLAFARVRRAFGWIVASSVAGVGVIFGALSHQIPGRAHAPQTTGAATGTGATGTTGTTGNSGNTGNTGAGAVSPPAPTQRAPTVVSGGTGY